MLIARAMNRVVVGARNMVGAGPRTECRRGGISWSLDLDEGIDLSIYLLGAYEPRLLRAYAPLLEPGAIVLDVGANMGAHTLHFARLVGLNGQVHAFEPTGFAFAKLRRNLALNPAYSPVVFPHQVFLVGQESEKMPGAVFASWPVNRDTTGVDPVHLGRTMSAAGAGTTTGDAYCSARGLQRLDLVKIDVDGHELSVLRGLHSTLRRFRPRILIEFAPFVFDGLSRGSFDELISFLAALGYEFRDANHGRHLPRTAEAFCRLLPLGGSMNVLVQPPGGVDLPANSLQ